MTYGLKFLIVASSFIVFVSAYYDNEAEGAIRLFPAIRICAKKYNLTDAIRGRPTKELRVNPKDLTKYCFHKCIAEFNKTLKPDQTFDIERIVKSLNGRLSHEMLERVKVCTEGVTVKTCADMKEVEQCITSPARS